MVPPRYACQCGFGGNHQPATGLLSGDALIVAIMQANGLTKLASIDTDFDRVPV
jgi:predicted nucleic acid-binding protein